MTSDLSQIAIIGASGRAAAQSAHVGGYHPQVADFFADQDTQKIAKVTTIASYDPQLVTWMNELNPTGWIYVGGFENYPELISELSQTAPLFGNSVEVLSKVRDPFYLQTLLGPLGSFPKTFSKKPSEHEYLIKSFQSAGGLNISEADDHRNKVDEEKDYFQQKLIGDVLSASFFSTGDEVVLLGVTKQLMGTEWGAPTKYQYAGNVLLNKSSFDQSDQLLKIAKLLSSKTNLQGLFGIDFILHQGRCFVLEINPRYTASMELIEAASDCSLVQAQINLFVGDGCSVSVKKRNFFSSAKLILFAQSVCQFDQPLHHALLEDLKGQSDLSLKLPAMADIPVYGTAIKEGQPMFTIFASGDNQKQTTYKIKRIAAECQKVVQEWSS